MSALTLSKLVSSRVNRSRCARNCTRIRLPLPVGLRSRTGRLPLGKRFRIVVFGLVANQLGTRHFVVGKLVGKRLVGIRVSGWNELGERIGMWNLGVSSWKNKESWNKVGIDEGYFYGSIEKNFEDKIRELDIWLGYLTTSVRAQCLTNSLISWFKEQVYKECKIFYIYIKILEEFKKLSQR